MLSVIRAKDLKRSVLMNPSPHVQVRYLNLQSERARRSLHGIKYLGRLLLNSVKTSRRLIFAFNMRITH